jgi:hypothetical protein
LTEEFHYLSTDESDCPILANVVKLKVHFFAMFVIVYRSRQFGTADDVVVGH